MINIKDIFESWAKSLNPPELEFNRAKERLEVCSTCDFKKELIQKKEWTLYCGACGCALKAKIYSSVINPCPKNKWDSIDRKYKSIPYNKENTTLL